MRRPIRPLDVRLLEATDDLHRAALRLGRANVPARLPDSANRYRKAVVRLERVALAFASLAEQAGVAR